MDKLQRLRQSQALRDLAAQTHLNLSNLVMPYFVSEGKKIRQPVKSLPGVFRFSGDELLKEVGNLRRSGVRAVILFGLPQHKDEAGSQAYNEEGAIPKAVSVLKKNFADVLVITDVCLCGYTNHGHCGILKSHQPSSVNHQPKIDNDETLKVLAKIALSHARAGADMVAPSSMMDGQVAAIREGLDKASFSGTAIMGYSAKFASSFYGPFREAADSSMKFGDRKSYQIDYRSPDEALREIEMDIQEGADIVMVKPALSYLDIIAKAKERFAVLLAAFNVSGEYAMVKAYAQGLGVRGQGQEIEKELGLEILTAIKRAGADIIISYWAKDLGKWLKS